MFTANHFESNSHKGEYVVITALNFPDVEFSGYQTYDPYSAPEFTGKLHIDEFYEKYYPVGKREEKGD